MVTDRPWPISRSATARAAAALSPATNLVTTSLVSGTVVISWRTCWLAEAASRTRRSTAVHLHEARAKSQFLPAQVTPAPLVCRVAGQAATIRRGCRPASLLLLLSVFAQRPSLARVKPLRPWPTRGGTPGRG